jgi:endo-1,4-beta-mannosidase
MKKLILSIFVLLSFISLLSFTSALGGTGTLADPFTIANWSDLNATRNNMTAHYLLIANLSSATTGYAGLGDSWLAIGNDTDTFNGSFNGNNNTISDLKILSGLRVGLFGFVKGNISNLGLVNINYTISRGGGIAGSMQGNLQNSYVTGIITFTSLNIGGLVGSYNPELLAVGGTITNCYSNVNITGTGAVSYSSTGGLFGVAKNVNVYNSYALGNIYNIKTSGGGLIGSIGDSNIVNCSSSGYLSATSFSRHGGLIGYSVNSNVSNSSSSANIDCGSSCGGLIGEMDDTVSTLVYNSYATGNVTGATGSIGGLVGTNNAKSKIDRCYATGNVVGSGTSGSTGGLVGYHYGNINNSYATGNVNSLNTLSYYFGGLVGMASGGNISNSYATGNVTLYTSNAPRGALVGRTTNNAVIRSSYATGYVNFPNAGSFGGGLVGEYTSGTAIDSYWDINKTGWLTSSIGTGKTSEELLNLTTFSNWSIALTTSIQNEGTPFLSWQILNNSFTWLMSALPNIKILFPQALTYNQYITSLNYSYSDNAGAGSCWYSKNAGVTNSSLVAAGNNFTGITAINGSNTWTLFCNNTLGVTTSKVVNFILNSLWYNNPPTSSTSFRSTEFIKRSGTNFTLGGQRYTFLSANAYYLTDYATNKTYNDAGIEINNSIDAVTEIFNEAQKLNVNGIRTWVGMFGGGNLTNWEINTTGGHYNLFLVNNTTGYNEEMFQALDYVIAEAGKRDIRILPVFVNNWEAYGGMTWWVAQASSTSKTGFGGTNRNSTDAFHDQFYTNAEVIQSFQTYVNYVLNRNNTITGILYKDDPTIFAWMLTNEARAKSDGLGRTKIANWTKNMTTYIKSIDSNHMVGLGIEGFGYRETWGEGTDMISAHNGTGVDFATFSLHPEQWNYLAQRSEGVANLDWIDGGITDNATLLWWVNGSGYSYNNRYAGSYVPAYTPALARHGYKNWVEQNVEWSKNLLGMPVLMQEFAIPTNCSLLTQAQKTLFTQLAITNFYKSGGDGILFWNLNHDDYYFSTNNTTCYNSLTGVTGLGCMDDGYSFYVSDNPELKARSQSVINAFNYSLYNNNGSSWVTLLNRYKYDFILNVDTLPISSIQNCSVNLSINNGTIRGNSIANSSRVVNNTDYTFQYNFNQGDKNVTWFTTCCSDNNCYSSNVTTTNIITTTPTVTLVSPVNNYVTKDSSVELIYSVTDYDTDLSYCELYINSILNQTDTVVYDSGTNQSFLIDFGQSSNSYNWSVKCYDIIGTSGESIKRTLHIDVDSPTIITTPLNNTLTSNSSINFTANISDNRAIKNTTFSIFNSTGLVNVINTLYNYFNSQISVGDVPVGYSTADYTTYIDVYGTSNVNSYADTGYGTTFIDNSFDISVWSYVTAPDSTRVYTSYNSYASVYDSSSTLFSIYSEWTDYGGTKPTEGFVVQIYDYNNNQYYWQDVGMNYYIFVSDFSGWTNDYAPTTPASPYSVATGDLIGEQEWRVWAKNVEDGETVYSANPAIIFDADYSYVGWQTTLSWDAVAGADSYIIYNTGSDYWFETTELSLLDSGDYASWNYSYLTVTPSSPYDYDKEGTLNVVLSYTINLADNFYTWIWSVFDWAGNMVDSKNNTLIIDTMLPQYTFTSPANNSYFNTTSVLFNVSSSDSPNASIIPNIDNSLVSWWRMDEANSTTVFDYINRNNGTITGGATQITNGKLGKAFDFDGNGDYVTILNGQSINITNALTISGWVYIKNNTNFMHLVSRSGGTNERTYSSYVSAGKINFVINSDGTIGGGKTATANDVSPLNEWVYYAGVFNGTTSVLYINGVLQATQTSYTGTIFGNSDENLYIGGLAGLQYFNGSIDDVMIFNRSLSADEIKSLYNATAYQYTHNFTTQGSHTFNSYIQDFAGNVNTTGLKTFTIDTTNPNATLVYPANNTYSNYTSHNLTANLSDNIGIKNVTLYVYNNSNDLINTTTVNYIEGTFTSTVGIVINLIDNVYKWFYSVFDWAGNNNVQNNTLTVDSISPNITLISPANNTITNNRVNNFTANLSDNLGISNATLFIYNSTGLVNQTTITYSGQSAIAQVSVNLSDGDYTWMYTVSDLAGNNKSTNLNTMSIIQNLILDSIVPSDGALWNTKTITFAVHTNIPGICLYSIDSSELFVMNSNNNYFISNETTLSNGEHSVLFTCNASGIIQNQTNSFYVYSLDQFSNSGSSSVSSTNSVEVTSITLANISIEYNPSYSLGIYSEFIVKAYDTNLNLTDVTNISVSSLTSKLEIDKITRLNVGEYLVKFKILNTTNSTNIIVDVSQNGKLLSQNFNVFILEPTKLEKLRSTISNSYTGFVIKTTEFSKNNWIFLVLVGSALVIIILLGFVEKLSRSKNK